MISSEHIKVQPARSQRAGMSSGRIDVLSAGVRPYYAALRSVHQNAARRLDAVKLCWPAVGRQVPPPPLSLESSLMEIRAARVGLSSGLSFGESLAIL